MLVAVILVLHIIVVGYWLGSDLVINSTFRYVSRTASLPFAERDRLLDHVLDIDQHVRYALILQLWLGTTLGALLGYFPGGSRLAWLATILGIAWLMLVELTHRLRRRPSGNRLGQLDRGLRYLTITILLAIGAGTWFGRFSVTGWLALKLALLAGVMLCGLGIRFELVRYFRVWADIRTAGSTAGLEQRLLGRYASSTAFLVLLWLFVVAIVVVSIAKPA